ncbi:MAG: glycosyltransferase, partial [Candidatus Eisenbacteria bacterium]|nr:glycosyltransferase [Candidatus Eisenbacteria bacterium]
DVIFASGPPFTGHWLGAKLAREHDLPLVLDFRDPWTRATFYPDRPEWAARIDRRLERSCLLQAARIVTVNEQIRDELQASAPELEADRFVVIPNGFDPADFAGIARHPSRHWTIAHVGSLFASRVPYTLLEVLERWIAEDPTVADEVRLRLVGRVCPEMIERVSRPPLSEIVIQDGYVSHAESVQAMVDADVLLLLTNEGAHDPGMITGKVFEYLGAGRPILTLAESGEATRILEMTGRGCAVAPRSAAEIRSALTSLREGSRERTSSPPGSTDAFSRPAQAQTLAATLSNAVSGSVPGQRT